MLQTTSSAMSSTGKIPSLIQTQRAFFETGATRDLEFRKELLRKLKASIQKNEDLIVDALKKDLRRHEFETYTAEIGFCINEINHTISQLSKWAKPKRVSTSILHFFSRSRILSDPKGVVLIIAPWNYPLQLTIAPLVAALAAGNCVVVKPSELAPATDIVLDKILKEAFDPQVVACVQGAVETTQTLLKERFDHIFYTGSTAVGKIIMSAAALHLTPVTLELGGKSPCIVDKDYPIEQAARRIVWGKFYNAGQTCVAPDYLMVHRSVKTELLEAMKKILIEFYGSNPKQSPDYARIINARHFERLSKLVKDGRIVVGGETDATERYIAPTILENVSMNSGVMNDEIFGPVLPVFEFDRIEETVSMISQRPYPLALYVFTNNSAIEKHVLDHVQFGGGCVNDTLIHLSSCDLPFGGVNTSGMGAYHGKTGFDLFSHQKSILKKSSLFDIKLRYPPYTKLKMNLVRKLLG